MKVLIWGLIFFPVIFAFVLKQANAQDIVGRVPASSVPADYVDAPPIEQDLWINRVMVEDDAGVLREMREDFQEWDETDRYAEYWNLSSTGLFVTPDEGQRRTYLSKRFLKYIDKRISGEIKQAEEGSTFHKIGKAQEALKPNTTVEFSPMFRFKFRARVLDREANMIVENPWVDCNAKVNLKGDMEINVIKNFSEVGVNAHLYYKVDEGQWVTTLSRSITNELSTSLSSTQNHGKMAFTEDADTRLQFNYYAPF